MNGYHDLRLYTDREKLLKESKRLQKENKRLLSKIEKIELELKKTKASLSNTKRTNKLLNCQNLRMRELLGEKPETRSEKAIKAFREDRSLTAKDLCKLFYVSMSTAYKVRAIVKKED